MEALDALADAQPARYAVMQADSDSALRQAALDEVAMHNARMEDYHQKLKAVKLSPDLLKGLAMFDKQFVKTARTKDHKQQLLEEVIDFDKSELD